MVRLAVSSNVVARKRMLLFRRSGSVSRVLSARTPGARAPAIIHLGPGLPADLGAAYPGVMTRRTTSPPLFGLAPDEVYRAASVAGDAVSSYLTFSPLPIGRNEASRQAVFFLWHCLWGRPPWELPSILSCGARTFLTPGNKS